MTLRRISKEQPEKFEFSKESLDEANKIIRYYFLFISPFFIWFLFLTFQADTTKKLVRLRATINWIIFSGILSIFFTNEYVRMFSE